MDKTQSGFSTQARETQLFALAQALLKERFPRLLSGNDNLALFSNSSARENFALEKLGHVKEGDDGERACWSSKQRQYARDLYADLGRFLGERCVLHLKAGS